LIIGVVWPLFYHTRSLILEEIRNLPRAERLGFMINDAFPDTLDTYEYRDVFHGDSSFVQNVRGRSFILYPLQRIIDSTRGSNDFLYGSVFWRGILGVVPNIFWSGKRAYFKENLPTEQMIQENFGLRTYDVSSTLFSAGYADGGFFGLCLYTFSFGFLIGFTQNRFWKIRSSLIALFLFGLCFKLVLFPEFSLETFLGGIRIVFFLLILDYIFGTRLNKITVNR